MRIVNSVLYGDDEGVADWVIRRVPTIGVIPRDLTCALGVVRNGRPVAGFVFHEYVKGVNVEVTVAADDPSWCLPQTLRQLFMYPFVQLGVPRLTCRTARNNKRCRKLIVGMGWKLEGMIRKGFDGRIDLAVYGMLPGECRFKPKEM